MTPGCNNDRVLRRLQVDYRSSIYETGHAGRRRYEAKSLPNHSNMDLAVLEL